MSTNDSKATPEPAAIVAALEAELERATRYRDAYREKALQLADSIHSAAHYMDRAAREDHLVRGLQRVLACEP